MALLGVGTVVFGWFISLAGFAGLLFVGFFSFFVAKISADTVMQQAMPDDFRGRAFALFDIAYNIGFIVPALLCRSCGSRTIRTACGRSCWPRASCS